MLRARACWLEQFWRFEIQSTCSAQTQLVCPLTFAPHIAQRKKAHGAELYWIDPCLALLYTRQRPRHSIFQSLEGEQPEKTCLLQMVSKPGGDPDQLPLSHTCFYGSFCAYSARDRVAGARAEAQVSGANHPRVCHQWVGAVGRRKLRQSPAQVSLSCFPA